MVMMMWSMTMAFCIALRKVMTKSARQPLQLLRKSLNKLLLVLHLPMCLHQHQECLHWQEICLLWHCSALAKLNTARMCSVLWLIYLPTPNVDVECLCAPVTCMVSSDTPLSNSRILKMPLVGDKLWVRPLGPHNNNNNNSWTPWTMSWEVSPTPLLPPLRRMWKRCARKGEQT